VPITVFQFTTFVLTPKSQVQRSAISIVEVPSTIFHAKYASVTVSASSCAYVLAMLSPPMFPLIVPATSSEQRMGSEEVVGSPITAYFKVSPVLSVKLE